METGASPAAKSSSPTERKPDESGLRPVLRLKPGAHRRVAAGHPWIYANEIVASADTRGATPGSFVTLEDADGRSLGAAAFDPSGLVVGRVLDADPNAAIDAGWIAGRLRRAAAIRDALFDGPYYRLIHAEADGLPGVIVDRYGDVFAVQLNASWAEMRGAAFDAALADVFPGARIVRRGNDAEGAADVVPLRENGAQFFADVGGGQKTGWFYDQRDNRAAAAALAPGRRVLDVYCYAGGFGVLTATAGAASVTLVDRSKSALDLAMRAASANGVADRVETCKSDGFAALERLAKDGARFGLVICDPPAFAKARKDVQAAEKAYRKLARLAAGVVEAEGWLVLGSCSQPIDEPNFRKACARGIAEAKRPARLIRSAGAAADHPRHPFLDESGYLKTLTYALD